MFVIITVNFNHADGLRNTIRSIEEQTLNREKFKYIVIDGSSIDESVDLIDEYYLKGIITSYVSEKDFGVYDAMNKGLSFASNSDFVLFLNSGDVFNNKDTLKLTYLAILEDELKSQVYYGDKVSKNGDVIKAFLPSSLKLGIINACHQSIFYKKSSYMYDLKYKIFSDYDFTCLYYVNNCHFKYLNFPVSIYEGGGMSSIHKWKTKKEIYWINFHRFGLLNFIKFMFVKFVNIFGFSHLLFLTKHN